MRLISKTPDRGRRAAPVARTDRRVPTVPPRVRDAFATALLGEQLVTPLSVQSAMEHSARHGVPVHEAVVAMGLVEERAAYRLLAGAAGMPFHDGMAMEPSPLALKLIPERVARRHHLLPVAVDDRTITYLTATPCDVDADRDVNFSTGRMPMATLTCPSELLAALTRVYPNRMDVAELLAKAQTTTAVENIEMVTLDTPSDSAIVNLCNTLVARALDAGASDLHLEPSETGILVRLRVGGVLEGVMTLPQDVAHSVRNRFKIMGGADISVRHRPQDGAFALKVGGRRVDVRLSTLPTTSGEKLVMRVIDSQSELQALETLGYDDEMLGRLRRILDRPDGLVLATGPTGSGKTTALYAALNYLRNGRVNIISVEDPVERTLAGVNQIPVNVRAGATFASVLRSVLRQDPNILMVGEVRDAEVAAIVGQAAYTGHLVLTSLHTTDAATAVTRLLNLGLEPFRIAESLGGILAQRLVRRLCPECRIDGAGAAVPGIGCARCHSTGYCDRVPMAELLMPTDEIRNVIARGATAVEIRAAMRRAAVPTMRDRARALLATSVTSEHEIARVLGAEDVVETPAPAAPNPSVLIADDEPITRTLVRLLLERDGYTVIEAQTGREAVDLALQHAPDLIVMDLNMPQMDGYQAIGEIRRSPHHAATPIVVVTAEEGPAVEQKVLAAGADDYIVKPFEPAVLTARVKAAFKRQQLAA